MSGEGHGRLHKLRAQHKGPCFPSTEYSHSPAWDGKLQKILGPRRGKIRSFRWLRGDRTGEGHGSCKGEGSVVSQQMETR